MRLSAVTFLGLLYLAVAPDRAGAQTRNEMASVAPPDGVIVAMEQHFVLEHLKLRPEAHFGVAFGIAMRPICDDHGDLKCWRTEKLVIDQTIILNN